MTSWVWMKGVSVAVADPISPVTPEDDRCSVKDLIQEHRDKIDKIKTDIATDPLYDATKHDDLWILRFWLSHKKSKPAIAAAKHTLAFRQQHKLDEKDIRDVQPHKIKEGMVHQYMTKRGAMNAFVLTVPDPKRGVLCFIDFAKFTPNTTKIISVEEWEAGYVYFTEWAHQWLDYVTRTTGRLTKSIRLVNLEGTRLSHMNRADTKRDGEVMAKMEDCYPQLLDTIKLCNGPSWMHKIWVLFRPIMPTRVVSKMDMIDPAKNVNERNGLLPHLTLESLPVLYGGKNSVPPSKW